MDDRRALDRVLTELGNALADRGLQFHVAIVGGSALLLSGEGNRPTADVDVIAVACDVDRCGLPGTSRRISWMRHETWQTS